LSKAKFLAAMLSGVSVVAISMAAQAQEAPAAAEAPASSVEEVVVTGSRIIQNGNNAPTPVTVVSTQQILTTTPSTLADAVKTLPVFAGYSAQTSNPGNSSQNSGANTLNLRSIGAGRTLTLFNGQRLPNGNIDQIPQMLISRVDIVTGGASAVYGSDAVAGVVNFIVDKKFNGLKINGQTGVSKYGDDQTWRLGVAYGGSFMDGRLHVEGSVEHFDDPGIFSKLTRQAGRDVYSTQGAGTAANPYRLVRDTRLNNTSFYGKILTGPLADQVFKVNGVASPFVHGIATGAGTVESGGDGAYFYNASLKTALDNTQYFGRADYELTDSINAWVQGSYVDGHNKNNHQTNEFRSYTLSGQNAFLAPQYRAMYAAANALAPAGTPDTFTFGKMMQQAPVLQPESFTNTYIFSGGFDGKFQAFGKDWSWELQGLTSEQKVHTSNNANMDNQKAIAALDAVTNPANGQIVCRVTLTNPGLYPGCVPINVFGPTSESPESIAYIIQKTDFTTRNRLDEVNASVTGSPFDTWAGPVQIALSGEMRKTSVATTSKYLPTDKVDCTGLRFNGCQPNAQGVITPPARWVSNVVAASPKASQTVKEIALETDVPLLKDLPFVESFNVNGAARYTYYDTSGYVTTWKVGGDWNVNSQLKLRATRSRDILAPSVTQLFGAPAVNPSGITDLHTGFSSVAPVETRANANLKPEVANTVTAGVVYRPEWLENFSISMDYYRIKIANGISSVSGNNATVARQCEEANGTGPLCALYIRPLPFSNTTKDNFPTLILSQNLNIANFYSRGIDTEVNYNTNLGPGRFFLRGLMTYQPKQVTVNLPGTTPLNAAGAAGLPSKRVVVTGKYTQGPFAFDLAQRWHNKTRRSSDPVAIYADGPVPSFYTTDMTVSYDIKMAGGTNQLFLAVQNVFNKEPPPAGATGGSATVPGLFLATTNGDDFMGRYFTVGFKFKR
jgi:outer membrane receptor protein involved in Fe transport